MYIRNIVRGVFAIALHYAYFQEGVPESVEKGLTLRDAYILSRGALTFEGGGAYFRGGGAYFRISTVSHCLNDTEFDVLN